MLQSNMTCSREREDSCLRRLVNATLAAPSCYQLLMLLVTLASPALSQICEIRVDLSSGSFTDALSQVKTCSGKEAVIELTGNPFTIVHERDKLKIDADNSGSVPLTITQSDPTFYLSSDPIPAWSGNGQKPNPLLTIDRDNVTIRGLKIRRTDYVAIHVTASHVSIEDCDIEDSGWAGISVQSNDPANHTVTDILIQHNRVVRAGALSAPKVEKGKPLQYPNSWSSIDPRPNWWVGCSSMNPVTNTLAAPTGGWAGAIVALDQTDNYAVHNVRVLQNTVLESSGEGVVLTGTRNSLAIGNQIRNPFSSGVYIDRSIVNVEGNVIWSNSRDHYRLLGSNGRFTCSPAPGIGYGVELPAIPRPTGIPTGPEACRPLAGSSMDRKDVPPDGYPIGCNFIASNITLNMGYGFQAWKLSDNFGAFGLYRVVLTQNTFASYLPLPLLQPPPPEVDPLPVIGSLQIDESNGNGTMPGNPHVIENNLFYWRQSNGASGGAPTTSVADSGIRNRLSQNCWINFSPPSGNSTAVEAGGCGSPQEPVLSAFFSPADTNADSLDVSSFVLNPKLPAPKAPSVISLDYFGHNRQKPAFGALAGCEFTLSPSVLSVPSGYPLGQTVAASFEILTTTGCNKWEATSDLKTDTSWIRNLQIASQNTGYKIQFRADANPDTSVRNGAISVFDKYLTVSQEGIPSDRFRHGVLTTRDPVDRISWAYQPRTVDPSIVRFEICQSNTWRKALALRAGSTLLVDIAVSNDKKCSHTDVKTYVLSGSQTLEFWKAKLFGIPSLVNIVPLSQFMPLLGGSTLTFAWIQN